MIQYMKQVVVEGGLFLDYIEIDLVVASFDLLFKGKTHKTRFGIW